MNQTLIIEVLVQSMLMGGSVVLPIMLVGLTVGITVGAIQAATQVQEQTLTFVPKVIAVGATAWWLMPVALDRYTVIFRQVIESIAEVVVL